MKEPIQAEKEKGLSVTMTGDLSGTDGEADAENDGKRVKENSNLENHMAKVNSHESNGSSNGLETRKFSKHHVAENGSVHTQSNDLGSRGKTKDDSCILLRNDESSRYKVEALKESLEKEASSFLRSCGWYGQVHVSMLKRKRVFIAGAGDGREDSD